MNLEEFIADVGKLATCTRCSALCKVAAVTNPDARLMKHAKRPKGYCANCSVTQWLRTIEPLPSVLPRACVGVLQRPEVQAHVYAVLKAANADAKPEEIDWAAVIANWDLPLIGVKS